MCCHSYSTGWFHVRGSKQANSYVSKVLSITGIWLSTSTATRSQYAAYLHRHLQVHLCTDSSASGSFPRARMQQRSGHQHPADYIWLLAWDHPRVLHHLQILAQGEDVSDTVIGLHRNICIHS